MKRSDLTTQKAKKVVLGFEPVISTESSEIFQMDEELVAVTEATPVAFTPPPIVRKKKSNENPNGLHAFFTSSPPQRPNRRPSQASIISPSASFQERLFPNISADVPKRPSISTVKSTEEVAGPSKKATTKQERRELQEKQRAEKAQRIAQGAQKLPQKQKQKQQNSPPRNPELQYRPPPPNKKLLKRQSDATQISSSSLIKRMELTLFSHLKPYSSIDDAVLRDKIATGLIHPTIISLGNQYSEMIITGGNARCIALMNAFQKVISDYTTPSGTSLHRHLTTHISKQVDFLTICRPLSASMKTAIRQLKFDISNLDSNLPDEDAKKKLCDSIDEFVNMRIELAQEGIVEAVLTKNKKIKNGDCILTFGRSSTVLMLMMRAIEAGIDFTVIVVDSRPKFEGKDMLAEFVRAGIKCTYVLTNSLPFVIKHATKVIIGTSSVLANGDLMSRVGTSIVCMAAYDHKVPVLALCESYKFSEQVRLDSFVWNELGNPSDLVDLSNRAPSEKLPPCFPNTHQEECGYKVGPLLGFEDVTSLKVLNLTYDITPAKFITVVACDDGLIPSTLVLSVLRNHPSN